MGLGQAAEVGLVKNTENKAVKIFSKQVGSEHDKICTLGQYLEGWDFEKGEANETKKVDDSKKFLNNNPALKEQIIKPMQ
jgi:hypothetical protein